MPNPCQTAYYQHDHIPSTSDGPSPAGYWQNLDANVGTQPPVEPEGCSCPLCSVTRQNNPPVSRTMVQQNSLLRDDQTIPYPFGVDNPTGILPNMVDQVQAQFGAPRAPENANHAPLRDAAGPPVAHAVAGLGQPQVLNTPLMESLRHLAGRYVNNPESLVNAIHLEPVPSGRFRVVITLEIDGFL